MWWKSSRISVSTCFGALRSRFRSLWTQHRCTAARGQISPTARRSPALPSMMASTGARNPRATRSSRQPFHAASDSPCAQLEREQMLPPVGQDADDAQHRHADHLSGSAYAQGEAIEVDVDHVEVGE